MIVGVASLCLLATVARSVTVTVTIGRRRRRALATPADESDLELACKVPLDTAHTIRDQLHGIVDHGVGSIENALEVPIEAVERKCFDIAYESIVELGLQLKEDPTMYQRIGNFTVPNVEVEDQAFWKLLESRQCLAYVELAKRGDPKALMWAWLSNSGTPAEKDQACGNVVNGMNSLLEEEQINGVKKVTGSNDEEFIVIEDFPLGDKLKVAEEKAGLSSLIAKVLGLGAMTAGSMLAGVCREWQVLTMSG